MSNSDDSLNNYLYRLRMYRGYSQKQLAGLLGVGRDALARFESGRRLPTAKVAMQLEIVLGTKLSEMYPDLYRSLSQQLIDREGQLPSYFARHILGRVLKKDPDDPFGNRGSKPEGLPPQDPASVRGIQHCLPF